MSEEDITLEDIRNQIVSLTKICSDIDKEVRGINLKVSYPVPDIPSIPAPEIPEYYSFQAMAAPRLRHLSDVNLLTTFCERAKQNGFNGLHVPIGEDFFDFEASDFTEVRFDKVRPEYVEVLYNVYQNCQAHGLHLHSWCWGDMDHKMNPAIRWGFMSSQEEEVYTILNDLFVDKKGITFGIGWDLDEWLSIKHANWIAGRLRVPFMMRHSRGTFNNIAPIPCFQTRRDPLPNVNSIRKYRSYFEDIVMVADTERYRHREEGPDKEGHVSITTQKELYRACKQYHVSAIFAYLPNNKDQDLGSDDYPQYWKDFINNEYSAS